MLDDPPKEATVKVKKTDNNVRPLLVVCLIVALVAGLPCCGDDDDSGNGGDTDTDTDSDTDTDTDTDSDTDTDTDSDTDTDTDTDSDTETDTYEDGTIICDPYPPTECSQLGDTPQEQYEGCCSPDLSVVYYCEEGILSNPFLCEDVTPGTHCGPMYHPDYGYQGMWCIE
jgi:hypothetical protein